MIEAFGLAAVAAWLFHRARRQEAPRPHALLRIPLTADEMAWQSGDPLAHRNRVGNISPQLMREALDAYLAMEEEAPPVEPTTALFFKVGEPRTFDEYGGQEHITSYLAACMDGWEGSEQFIGNQCFEGPAGSGKTLLAKVAANEMRIRNLERGLPQNEFIEVFTTDVPNVTALDRLMRRVTLGAVMFIDELHTIEGKEHWTKFLEVLENKRYQFEGDRSPTLLPPFTILAATTDFGTLSEPWRRRFQPHRMNPATYDEILRYVEHRGFPISTDAARAIVDRVHWGGVPWEALWAFAMAKVFARARHAPSIAAADVEKVWTVNGIDEYGLRPVDRDVMRALFSQPRHRRDLRRPTEQEFVCYAASEENTAQMARVDIQEYKRYIRPKLMRRGLLEVRISYGQALTPLAIERYGYLRETAREQQ